MIEEAIEMLEKFIKEHKLYNIKQADNLEENIETILNYIDRLQKEIERIKSLDIHKLVEDAETGQLIHKDKIRNKIKELEENIETLKKIGKTDGVGIYYSQINILKELLGE